MRPQPDLPPRPPRRGGRSGGSRVAGRGRAILGITLGVVFVLLVSVRGLAGFYTDYLWFDSLGRTQVWRTILGAKLALTVVGMAVFFGLCWANLKIAERLAPPFRPSAGEDDLVERYHELVGRRATAVRLGVVAFLSFVVGVSLGSVWNEWLLYANRVSFGQKDATFHTDIGFYVFQLPFITSVLSWLFSALVLVVILTALSHVMNGGIRFNTQLDRVTPQVKAHLSVLLALLALVQAGRYWFDRYTLTFSTRGTVDGATYTDVNVELRAYYLLILIALFATALFIANIWRRGWVLPVMAVGLWMLVVLLAGEAVPAFVQRFRVEPSESSIEKPYIEHNIKATRAAYGLANVDDRKFDFKGDLSAADLTEDAETVRNIRLWDADVMRLAFESAQQIKSFYAINDVDIDRYDVDGKQTQVMVAARNLRTAGVPQSSWEATHLAYTHGYGVVVARANAKTDSGAPDLLASDIPVKTTGGLPEAKEPGIYFGENKSGYVIVNTDRKEIDYQDSANQAKFKEYAGKDGITIGSGFNGTVRKAAFALRFNDINPLISGNVNADSRVMIERDVAARIGSIAPFLALDHDPYVVLIDGRVKYVVDGYTTTRHYPNAQRADTGGLNEASGLRGRSFNYARNSVKAVVDAYDGTVDLYITDTKDPILKAYRNAFPDLFTPLSEAPKDLREHFRYPEDLFTVQTQMWAKYHVADPDTFYNGNDAWNIPQEPGVTGITKSATAVGADGQVLTAEDRFVPQYLLMRLPGDTTESFVMMRPFVPAATGGTGDQRLLTSFMVASSDPDDYGKLQTFIMPGSNLPDGPKLVAGKMKSDPAVSQLQTLLCQQGSTCELRNLVMTPIADSLLYVRSLFVAGDEAGVPALTRIIVSYQSESGSKIAVDTTLRGALVQLFGDDLPAEFENTDLAGTESTGSSGDGSSGDKPDTKPTGTLQEQEDRLIAQIVKAFDDADALARKGDQVGYAKKIQEARDLAAQLQALREKGAGKGGGSGSGSGSGKGSGSSSSSTTTTAPSSSTTTTTAPDVTTTTSAGA